MRDLKNFNRLALILAGIAQCTCASASDSEFTDYATAKLQAIHSNLTFFHGSLLDEYPEQLMTTIYLPSDAKVLELGGNVGRNSCIIASLLEDARNLVTVESSNRDYNGLQFHIEASAISKVPLIQSGWRSFPSAVDVPGYFRVDTISFDALQEQYGIVFDTLVADCEGALYYILKDDPRILDNIKLVIVENDYSDIAHFKYVIDLFKKNGLQLVYDRDLFAEGFLRSHFYQVWKK